MYFKGRITGAAEPRPYVRKDGREGTVQQFMLTLKGGGSVAFMAYKDAHKEFLGSNVGKRVKVTLEAYTHWHAAKSMWYNNLRCTGIEYDVEEI